MAYSKGDFFRGPYPKAVHSRHAIYAVAAALCTLVRAELCFGPWVDQAQIDTLRLLPVEATPAAMSCWVLWSERRATICYDSLYGVGVASGLTPIMTDHGLGFWARFLWRWLQRAGWRLSLGEVFGAESELQDGFGLEGSSELQDGLLGLEPISRRLLRSQPRR